MAIPDGWLGSPDTWVELAAVLRAAGEFGLDTEFSGVQLDKQSPVGRAAIHVWSVAIATPRQDPRGFHRCRAWVLPSAALACPELRAVLEDPGVTKAVHNQSVDAHALRNHGVQLRGAVNTLGLVRWKMPGLINQAGRFALKPLMVSLLGRAPVCSFKELVSYDRMIFVSSWKKVTRRVCACGVDGCRKKLGHGKTEVTEDVEVVREKRDRGEYRLEDIVDGHERWELLLLYAADDAVAALQVKELCDEVIDHPAPWPYGGGRPGFSQAVEESVIEMEAVGFHVDVEWCRVTAARAEADELAELAFLRRWFRANVAQEDPEYRLEDADIDAIWSSPVQLVPFFDSFGFPRSPVWGKGRVKPGDVKMDATALGWIADNHPESAQLIEHLIHLKRIRSGKKYLVKLRDSGGKVHPICGPAGDEDERSGAVTGRLGVKGELEAQQLPKEGEKDLYEIRRAIVAWNGTAG